MACHSVVGLSWGSQITTTEAAWMLSPTPPATICDDQHGPVPGRGEFVDHDLPRRRRDRARERAEHLAGQGARHLVEDVTEVGEDDDPTPVVLGLLDDLDRAAASSADSLAVRMAAWRIAMKFPADDGVAVVPLRPSLDIGSHSSTSTSSGSSVRTSSWLRRR